MARSTLPSQNVQNTPCSDHFWKLTCRKSVRCCGAKRISRSKCQKHHMLGPLLKVQMWFCVACARDSAPCQKWAKCEGFVAFPKTIAAMGHLKRIWKDAFCVAGTVQETSSSEMLRLLGVRALISWEGLHFWSIRSSGLLRWFRLTGAALRMTRHHFSWQAQYFRQMEWNNRKTHWYAAVSFALNFPFLKEVSQNCFGFDVVNLKNWGGLAE